MRASDAEREETVVRLHHALSEGRLDSADTETRVAAAYAARHRDELCPLLADLPDSPHTAAGAPSWLTIWTSVVWRARTTLQGPRGGHDRAALSAGQRRIAAALLLLAMLWLVACVVLGAALVGT